MQIEAESEDCNRNFFETIEESTRNFVGVIVSRIL